MKTELHICYTCAGALGPDHVCSLVGGSVSDSSQESRLVDSIGLPCGDPIPSVALNPSPTSSLRVPKLCPMFGCGPLYLFHSAAGWSL